MDKDRFIRVRIKDKKEMSEPAQKFQDRNQSDNRKWRFIKQSEPADTFTISISLIIKNCMKEAGNLWAESHLVSGWTTNIFPGIRSITGSKKSVPTAKSGYVIRSGTVSVRAGRYYVSVLVEIPDIQTTETHNEGIGIDLGLKEFAVVSNGKTYKNINKSKK